jgi:hypothetical protein
VCAEPGADRVPEHVLRRVAKVILVADRERGEAVAEEVAAARVALVERLGEDAVHTVEAPRKASELGVEDRVVVVRHQAEDVAVPALPADFECQKCQEETGVLVIPNDRAPRNAASGDVVDALPWKRPSRQASHSPNVAARRKLSGPRGNIATLP